MAGTQISVVVKCNATKMVAKFNKHRNKVASCWKKRNTYGMVAIAEDCVVN